MKIYLEKQKEKYLEKKMKKCKNTIITEKKYLEIKKEKHLEKKNEKKKK